MLSTDDRIELYRLAFSFKYRSETEEECAKMHIDAMIREELDSDERYHQHEEWMKAVGRKTAFKEASELLFACLEKIGYE